MQFIAPSWQVVSNSDSSSFGRILVCWNPLELSVLVVGRSAQALHCSVSAIDGSWSCVITVIYGNNSPIRHSL